MDDTQPPRMIQVGQATDGTVTYLVEGTPDALPPVLGRDLARAWDSARQHARDSHWGAGRLFRFRRPDGNWTDLALRDRDACCWAAAVDRSVGMQTGYGLSLCLRLLALVELLGRASWATGLFTLARGETRLHPALLRTAANATLTPEGGFEEHSIRSALSASLAAL